MLRRISQVWVVHVPVKLDETADDSIKEDPKEAFPIPSFSPIPSNSALVYGQDNVEPMLAPETELNLIFDCLVPSSSPASSASPSPPAWQSCPTVAMQPGCFAADPPKCTNPPASLIGNKRCIWTAEEDAFIDRAVRFRGLRWKAIAEMLPGRSETGCRKRWMRCQQRRLAARGIKVSRMSDVVANVHNVGAMRTRKPPSSQPPPEVELWSGSGREQSGLELAWAHAPSACARPRPLAPVPNALPVAH
ncbi:hypothetical protein EMIHUDRAFT_225326 [Emiliania huxleyi CCMP1516]|uniref:Myb-like domain-containing protein n=2 Tax=Emiliania huxleyi TaxID=2903 RepID=A0A0D3KNZ6_EMIH1|nr:hypothetical protein EMIHUDRAFT_225326 [Emiliania huxleyi CCMP1516]EOD37481.1 hypothetical protein EMIHUDRAFT_225326 [Emiliania huxleyi CCMP1516]|eukprot:XP_005789910.1 hypothetical protein EMIHUDRAFT_225326 [Emiliania huxleyi CCMP1516]